MENKLEIEMCKDILSFGIESKEKILHLGCGDKQTNLLFNMDKLINDFYYLGVDVDIDVIDSLEQSFKNNENYTFTNITVQNFLDYIMSKHQEIVFSNTIITGIFDKPTYKEKQFIFISMVVKKCLLFSNKVIFSINGNNYNDYTYNILYVLNNLISTFDKVQMIKKSNLYIFCITN